LWVGQASDEASGSVDQAGAGNPDDKSKPRAAARGPANEFFGSVAVTDTDTGSDHRDDRAGRRVWPVGVVPVVVIDHRSRQIRSNSLPNWQRSGAGQLSFDQHLGCGAHGLNA
jgi:hypothetical protein